MKSLIEKVLAAESHEDLKDCLIDCVLMMKMIEVKGGWVGAVELGDWLYDLRKAALAARGRSVSD